MSNVNATPSPASVGTVGLTLPFVCRKTGIGRSTVYALMDAGRFPAPAHVGRRAIWKESEIDAWLDARFAERDARAAAAGGAA